MHKYLYLTEKSWARAWTEGGKVPIRPASVYRSKVRSGTSTPDENVIHRAPLSIPNLANLGIKFEECKNITMSRCYGEGIRIPDFAEAMYYTDDGLILSFCNKKSRSICERLNKSACVRIHDIESLKSALDRQIGVVGTAKDCDYTENHERDHFLKSVEDSWQDEYRIFWPVTSMMEVRIPPKTARLIKL